MNEEVLIGVVIPCTDRVQGLDRCLRSVIGQKGNFTLEILLIENNSKDRCVIKNLVNTLNSPMIKHHYLDKCGNANVARNFGANRSEGQYIAYLDSDDYWDNDHIQARLDFGRNHSNIYAQFSGHHLNYGQKVEEVPSRAIGNESAYNFLFGKCAGVAQTSSYFLKKSVFGKVSWDETLKRNQDYDFFIAVHNTFGWSFNSIVSATVVWEIGEKRLYSVDSFKKFYLKHKLHMSKLDRANYVAGVLRALCLNSRKEYMEFILEGRRLRKYMAMPGRLYSYSYSIAKVVIVVRTLLSRLA